ncbi:filamentous hemagglutinin N-terminal domain-containing protein [Thalassospira profundimaris]|nr:filamentous hemagglutinin N-terminal domain-containing protein [Thalassospira profundimaris]
MSKNSFTNPARRPLKLAATRAALSHPQTGEALAPARQRQAKGLTPFNLLAGATALGSFFYATAHPAQAQSALPQGGTVAAGNVTIGQSAPDTMNVVQGSNSAIVNWQSFNVGSGNTVNFQQPSSSSVILNRVVGNDPSAIFGTITANGTVMLVNPNGVVFGPGSRVDVGSLVATTANIRDADFMAGNYNFDIASADPSASIINAGDISIRDAGLAALVAPNVQNAGVINARLGKVSLGGAKTFALDFHGDGLLSFGVSANVDSAPVGKDGVQVASLVSNSGSIIADGGVVAISARAVKDVIDNVINTQGVIQANSVSTSNGRIVLSGGDNGAVVAGGSIKATGNDAGETGGSIVATGDRIAVSAGAEIDASGKAGGGLVAIGSEGDGENGRGTGAWSNDVSIAKTASLKADAIENGKGGNVTVLSENLTDFGGSISAKGGAEGGNGGFAEVSSHKGVKLTGSVDLTALNGDTGTFLLDPDSLTIVAGTSGSLDGNAGDGSVGGSDANSGANTISASVLEGIAGTSNIILEATGLITVDTSLSLQTASGHSFTLKSTGLGGITFTDATDTIATNGGDIVLQATSPGASITNIANLSANGGTVLIQAARDIELAGNISTGTGIGAVFLNSVAGSIYNKAGLQTAPTVTTKDLTVSTGTGNIGAEGNAIVTSVTGLTIEAGGSFAIDNSDSALTSLNLSMDHLLSTNTQTYALTAAGLTFEMTDTADAYVLTSLVSTDTDVTFAGEKSLNIGQIGVGTGDVTLTVNSGAIYGAASTGNHIVADNLTISTRDGVTGNDVNRSLRTDITSLNATTESGGLYISNTDTNNGGLTVSRFEAAGGNEVTQHGALGSLLYTSRNLTVGDVTVASGTLYVEAGLNIADDSDDATSISAQTVELKAGADIGTSSRDLQVDSKTLDVSAFLDIYLDVIPTSGTVTLQNLSSTSGKIDLTTHTDTTITSASTSDGNNIDIAMRSDETSSSPDRLNISSLTAGSSGDVTLTLTNGYVTASQLTADDLIVSATVSPNGYGQTNSLATSVNTVDIKTLGKSGSLVVSNSKALLVKNIEADQTTSSVDVTASTGDLTIGTIDTSASVDLAASNGNILAQNANNNVHGTSLSLIAANNIGGSGEELKTYVTSLTVRNSADIYIQNIDSTLTSLSITNYHDQNQVGDTNVVQLTSDHLDFNVTDSGTAVSLNRVIAGNLTTFNYESDSSLVIGQIGTNLATVTLKATGSISDDNNANTRLMTSGSLTLDAGRAIGTSDDFLEVSATTLKIKAGSDVFLRDIADLASLDLNISHADSQHLNAYGIEANGFEFTLTDDLTNGYTLSNLYDNSTLNFTFTTDADLTVGSIDVSDTGSLKLNVGGDLLDDGNTVTDLIAKSISLNADKGIGSADDAVSVRASTLSGDADAGLVNIIAKAPIGDGNTNTLFTVSSLQSTQGTSLTLNQGDLVLTGQIKSGGNDLNVTVDDGSILGGSSGQIYGGSGSTVKVKASGDIGVSGDGNYYDTISISGSNVDIQSTNGNILTSGSVSDTTLTMQAGGSSASYTLTNGNLTVGDVTVSSGDRNLKLAAQYGSIIGQANTSLQALDLDLSATSGSINSINTNATDISLAAANAIGLTSTATLTNLSIDAASNLSQGVSLSANGQSFAISYLNSAISLDSLIGGSGLDFSLTAVNDVALGQISLGNVDVKTSGAIRDDGDHGNTTITATSVSLTSGGSNNIGSADSSIDLNTNDLTVTSGGDIYVSSAKNLTRLNFTSTNSANNSDTVYEFGSAPVTITDGDTELTAEVLTTNYTLVDFSLTSAKNIIAKDITASGTVSLETTSTGVNSNISNFDANTVITASNVELKTNASNKTYGQIGASDSALKLGTGNLSITSKGSFYVDNTSHSLSSLTLDLAHVNEQTSTTQTYSLTHDNNVGLTLTDSGSQVALSLTSSSAIDFALSMDRQLSLGTVDAGTSSTGSVSLTTTGQASGTNEHGSIVRSSGTITGGTVVLNSYESVTANTNTQNLSIDSSFNVNVSNSTTLNSLKLDVDRNNVDTGYGSSNITYTISSTGLTFSNVTNYGSSSEGFKLGSISQSGLDLEITANKTITVGSVNVGSGNLTLTSSRSIESRTGSSVITAGDLTLNAQSVGRYSSSDYFYIDAARLMGTVQSSARISDNGGLTVAGFSATDSSGWIELQVTQGDLSTEAGKSLSAHSIGLVVNDGNIGVNNNLFSTDAKLLTVQGRGSMYLKNTSDLYDFNLTANHVSSSNVYNIQADDLAFTLTDDGSSMIFENLVDDTGLDFTFSTDRAIQLGVVNVGNAGTLDIKTTATNGDITYDSLNSRSDITARSITLRATGSIADSSHHLETNAKDLTLLTGGNVFIDNSLDLASLSITSSQGTGGTAPFYEITAAALTFNVTDDGTTNLTEITDTSGLELSFDTVRGQKVGSINTTLTGSVDLESNNSILGIDGNNHITTGEMIFTNENSGNLGESGTYINLSAATLTTSTIGDVYINNDRLMSKLSLSTENNATGTYSIIDSANNPDGGHAVVSGSATAQNGVTYDSIADNTGLSVQLNTDDDLTIKDVDLNGVGIFDADNSSGNINGDSDSNTAINAATVDIYSSSGTVGTAAKTLQIKGGELTVRSSGDIDLTLSGRTDVKSLTIYNGTAKIHNETGDIVLGNINLYGHEFYLDNQGGSILSGTLNDAGTVSLIANGSIGNVSAISINANGNGTTTLAEITATTNSRGATGTVNISESYGLDITQVTATSDVTITAGSSQYNTNDITVHSISAGTGTVTISSAYGDVFGAGSNMVTAGTLAISATRGNIGASGAAINTSATALDLSSPRNIYVSSTSDLSSLSIDRRNDITNSYDSSGTVSISAAGLTWTVTDANKLTTLTNITDLTGLDLTYKSLETISIGTINVGSGSVDLSAHYSTNDFEDKTAANIISTNNNSTLKAGSLTLTASNSNSSIGTSSQALKTDVDSLVANSGTGGINVNNAKSMELDGISTTGDLAITIASGDLVIDTLSYGSDKNLSLTASSGSIFTAVGKTLSLASGDISLSASNGIGSATSRLQLSGSGAGAFSANVTGNGDIYLNALNGMTNQLSAHTTNGAVDIVSNGNIRLTDIGVGQDAVGNNIIVTAKSGNITIGGETGSTGVVAGANYGKVNLTAQNGAIYAGNADSALGAFEVRLTGANGVGTQNNAIAASGQRVLVSATNQNAGVYLRSSVDSTFSSVSTNGGVISIAGSNGASILVANAISAAGTYNHAGDIIISTTGEDGNVIVGNLNAKGSAADGKITLTSNDGSVLDDNITETRITGSQLEVNSATGVGSSQNYLQTIVTEITGTITSDDVFIDDNNANGISLGKSGTALRLANGSLTVTTSNKVTLQNIKAETDGNNVKVTAADGDVSLVSVIAGATSFTPQTQPVSSAVTLKATNGSIVNGGSESNPTLIAGQLSLEAKNNIGAFSWVPGQSANIDALQVIVGGLDATTHTDGSVISVFNQGTGAITLGDNIHADGSVSVAIGSKGNVTWGSFNSNAIDKLYLTSEDTLTLGENVQAGSIYLSGKNDIVSASSETPRTLKIEATTSNGIELHSGSAGGTTTIDSTTSAIRAEITENGGALVVNNTGALSSINLSAYNDVTLNSNVAVSGGTITTNGIGHTASVTAETGDITVGTINTGSEGTIELTSNAGSIAIVENQSSMTAKTLSLTSATGIGSADQNFHASIETLNATVTGTGAIYVAYDADRSTGILNAHDGDIFVTGLGNLDVLLNKIALTDGHEITVNAGQSDVTLTGTYDGADQVTSFDVTGGKITTGALTTGGSQTYKGTTILNGDLQASAISITGDVQASGTALSLTSSNNGNITVTGSIEGTNANEDTSLTVNAGTGDVTIGSATVKIANVALTGANIAAGNVTSSGSQTYNGAVNLNGAYVAGGEFKVTGAALLTGNTNTTINTTSNNSNVTFGGTIDSTNNRGLEITSGSGSINFSGAIGGTNILQYLTLTTSASQADQLTDGQIVFGSNANVKVVDDFKQVGGRQIFLPVSIESELGNVEISGAATLKAGATSIKAVNENEGGRVQFLSTINGNNTQLKVEAADRIEFVGDYTDIGAGSSVELIAPQMTVSAVSTKGAQSYTGQTTRITGDLTAGSILVDGNATLAAQTQVFSLPQVETTTFDTSAANGAITIKGTLDGGTDNVVMKAGSGAVAIDDAVSNSTSLTITGGTIALHDVTTTADQSYTGTTTLDGTYQAGHDFTIDGLTRIADDTEINTESGTLLLKGTVNSVTHADLTLNSGNTKTVFDFALGNTSALGKLTINSGENGVTEFARTASISVLDGLVYTGGIKLLLPANVTAANGPITLGSLKLEEGSDPLDEIAVKPQSIDGAIATLPSGKVTIRSGDDITIAGLIGTSTDLVMTSGTGDIRIGSKEGTSDQKINVKSLNVAVAGTANLYGTIGGISGFDASYEIGPLKFAPYFINDAFWRNRDLPPAATKTTPLPKPPSTPQVDALFNLTTTTTGVTPNVIAAFAAPTVLNVGTAPVAISATTGPSVINTTGTVPGSGRVTVNPGPGATSPVTFDNRTGTTTIIGGSSGGPISGGAAAAGFGSTGNTGGTGGAAPATGGSPDGGTSATGGNQPGVVDGQSSDSGLIQSNDQ